MRLRCALFLLAAGPLAAAQQTELASLSDGFAEYQTLGLDVSDDGRSVVFAAVSRLGYRVELFDRDLETSSWIWPVTSAPQGLNPAISGDGTTVAFDPVDALLVSDLNFVTDIYVVSSVGTGLELVSIPDGPPGGSSADGQSRVPRLSDDGDRVVFQSSATNLTADALNTTQNVFVRIRSTNSTVLVSSDAAGVPADEDGYDPTISADGRYVVFSSAATNLVPGDDAYHDVFAKDLDTGAITLVSRNSLGEKGDGNSLSPSISADGRYVVFASDATNFTPGSWSLIYRHDRDPDGNGVYDDTAGVTELVSLDVHGDPPAQHCTSPKISDDGQRVLFYGSCDTDQELQQNRSVFSGAAGLDAFLFDFSTQTTTNVHVDSLGRHGDGGCYSANFEPRYLAISGDGSTAAFGSAADNLDANHPDGHGFPSVFAHDVAEMSTGYVGHDRRGSNGFFPELSMWGGLATGESAEMRLRRAPPSAPALVFAGFTNNPTSGLGGTIVPVPWFPLFVLPTDSAGEFTATLSGGGGPLDFYLQWVVLDTGFAPAKFAFSNALRISIAP